MKRRIAYWRWLWDTRQWWFLRTPPKREFKTRLYVGLPGSGKTLCMVRDCLRLMDEGVTVYSNVQIVDRFTGAASMPVSTWLDVLRVVVSQVVRREPAVIAIDEIHEIADARNWSKTPGFVRAIIRQRRHFGVGLMATTQAIDQVEKALRTLVDEVVSVRRAARAVPRHSLYALRYFDPRLDELTGDGNVGGTSYLWIGALPYVSYSTSQLIAADDFSYMTDDEAQAEIEALAAELRAHLEPAELSVFDAEDSAFVSVFDE